MKTYKKTKKSKKALYFKDALDEINANYPPEVAEAFKNGEDFTSLDKLRTGFMKINDMDRKFGVSPLFKALKALIVLDNIENADVAIVVFSRTSGENISSSTNYCDQALTGINTTHGHILALDANENRYLLTPTSTATT